MSAGPDEKRGWTGIYIARTAVLLFHERVTVWIQEYSNIDGGDTAGKKIFLAHRAIASYPMVR